ncbi:MAG: PAS domain-containing protein, partial [Proteobacteria bacterium]|nr:PAS domain-containing protein [Pseudomonadota bacterium]
MQENPSYAQLLQRISELENQSALPFAPKLPGTGVACLQGNAFFQTMMDNVPDLIWAKDMEDRFLFVNKAMCQCLLNCETTQTPVGKTDRYFTEKERKQGFLHTFGKICEDSDKKVKETRTPGRFIEEGFVRGKYLVLEVHKAPFFNAQGEMAGTVGCGRDVTAHR